LLAIYLGIEVTQSGGDISIKQSAYARKILKEAGMLESNETIIPMDPGTRLTKTAEGTMVNSTEYRSLIGCLRYLLHTRPDLSYSVRLLSRFMQEPKEQHMKVIKKILRYVKGTKDYGITYKHNGGNKIHGYSDSSYGVNTQEGKGTTGIIFYYGESPISWSTQKQAAVALSSCESEFIAATAAATQALWLKRLLSRLTHSDNEKITILVDNKSAIALMKNPVFHGRSKHIDTKYHFIRECVERDDIQYRNYGLRGDRHVNLFPLGPPAYDPYRTLKEVEGDRPDVVYLSRPSEQGSTQLRQPTLTPPVLMSEQEYRSFGLRGERHNNKTPMGLPAHGPYRTEQEKEGTHPDTVFLSRPSEQEPMQIPKPILTPPTLMTEQDYRSYGLREERQHNLTAAASSAYDPYKTEQVNEIARPPYNPYDDHTSSLVERYLSHPVASTSAPSGSYHFDTTRVVDDIQESLYAVNAIPNTFSDHNQNVGQRQDEHVNKSAPVSSRYAFTGPSILYR
nr:ribonuclease H-like domain, reverse transcriptase, RNA-dependent DNA polymerase [Tanacetum cinerariifolium]